MVITMETATSMQLRWRTYPAASASASGRVQSSRRGAAAIPCDGRQAPTSPYCCGRLRGWCSPLALVNVQAGTRYLYRKARLAVGSEAPRRKTFVAVQMNEIRFADIAAPSAPSPHE